MGTTATATPWPTIAARANKHREQVLHYLRQWQSQSLRAGLPTPSRWFAAYDSAARPVRLRLVGIDPYATDRDRAEAASDDLSDAVAVAWSLVRWLSATPGTGAPPVDRLAAELELADQWLEGYPALVAAHEQAIDRLFSPEPEATL